MPKKTERTYLRFPVIYRIEHWIYISSFIILGLTGLIQKFATWPISQTIIKLLGGVERTRNIHHVAAIVMMFATIYHLGILGYRVYVKRSQMAMLPGIKDVINAWQLLMYDLRIGKNRPQQARYTFQEKFEYWAVVWGTVVMGLTGFLMWNPITATKLLSGQWIPAAKAAHGGEAILAVLAIIIWHMYHVFIKHFNKSMYTGKMGEHEMIEEHPIELADIKAGLTERQLDPALTKKRERIFFPVYAVAAAIMLVGVYFFIGYEDTAVATVPPIEAAVTIFSPVTPSPFPTHLPTATPLPTVEVEVTTWENVVGPLIETKCLTCHSESGMMGGLSLASYQDALTGGSKGPAIVPGDSASSVIVQVQSAGGHAGQLTDDELQTVIDWIDAGAVEK